MSVSHDFSRRFFAEFIAARVKAWGLDGGGPRPTVRAVASVDEGPNRARPDLAAKVPVDDTRGLIPGLGTSGG